MRPSIKSGAVKGNLIQDKQLLSPCEKFTLRLHVGRHL